MQFTFYQIPPLSKFWKCTLLLQLLFWNICYSQTKISSSSNNMEYWFDEGFTNRQLINFTDPLNIDLTVTTNSLNPGSHTLFYRFRSSGELWSGVAASQFTKNDVPGGATQMEYWFNGDFDNRQLQTVADLSNVDYNLNTGNIPLGVNTLYTRFQKNGGTWSSIATTQFLNNGLHNGTVEMQYWYDDALGLAKTVTISNPSNIDFNTDVSQADTGIHIFCARFRNPNGLWSGVTADTFSNTFLPTYCPISNPPTGDSLKATRFLCQQQIILNNQDGIVNLNAIKRKDLAKITYRGLVGSNDPDTLADYLPSLFGDLQQEIPDNSPGGNAYYFKAVKLLSYLDFGDGIPPFNPGRLNFHPEDTIVRGYVLKVLLEAWGIKPDASLPNPYLDLVPDAEVNGYILKAAQLHIIYRPDLDGPDYANFRPFEAATRIEAFIMLQKLMFAVSKPEIKDEDYYLPFLRSNTVSNTPSLGDGNFSSYGESPFTIKGVPSLNFSFNYNSSATELPDEVSIGKTWNGKTTYNQLPLGKGWSHSYNAYIILDQGNDDIASYDDRYIINWPGGNVQVYIPSLRQYSSVGIYDSLRSIFNVGAALPRRIIILSKSQVEYTFESLAGNSSANILHLISIKDRHSNTVTLTYENGFSDTSAITLKRLKTVNDGHNRKFGFTYLPNTNLIDSVAAIAGSLARSVKFDYIGGRLTQYINAKKDFTVYNYSDRKGQEYLLTKIVLPKGNVITNTYNSNNKLTSNKINDNQQTLIQSSPVYNAANTHTDSKITSIVDGMMQVHTMRSNQYGMPETATGPGYNHSIQYNNTGNNVQLPSLIQNNLTQVRTTTNYDAKANLLSISKRDVANTINITESYAYNSKNDILSRTDGNNNTSTFQYNITGQLTTVNAPIGTTTIAPNTNGTVQSITNPSGITTSFTYDSYGNLAQTNMPLAITSGSGYDAYGRVISSTNPNNKSVLYQYDESDNLKQETYDQPGLNYTTQYRVDKNDNLIEVENAKGDITYLTYNNNDQLVKEQFGAYAKRYNYTEDGRMKTFTNPNGVNFTNIFNSSDQLINDGYADYTYNADNTLSSITRSGKTTTFDYDALKRIKKATYNDFANNTVDYEYDNNNNLKKINYSNGAFVVKYNYDANNRLQKVTDNNDVAWATYAYLTDGRLNTQTNRNGTIVKYFYDAAGRMDSMATVKTDGSIIAAYGYTMDKVGNHQKENSIQPFTLQIPEFSYTDSFTYSNTNRLLTKNADTYSYDDNGNLIAVNKSGGTQTYNYDIKNNLTSYTDAQNNITFEYDAMGQRRRRNNTRYVLDNAYNVIAETDLNGAAQYYYIQGLGLIARVKVATGQPYYYHYDYRGSTVAITNSTQTITHKYNYSAFGETQQAIEEDYNAYRYVGKYGVGYETKDLTFMRARYYQPSVGRFNSEDPVWGVNLYGYGGNNPVNMVDVSGMLSDQLWILNTQLWFATHDPNASISGLAYVGSTRSVNSKVDEIRKSNANDFDFKFEGFGDHKFKDFISVDKKGRSKNLATRLYFEIQYWQGLREDDDDVIYKIAIVTRMTRLINTFLINKDNYMKKNEFGDNLNENDFNSFVESLKKVITNIKVK